MTEYEKAEQDVAAAKVAERIAEWKAMEAKAAYYRYAGDAMAASAEVMGSRIRRDNALAAEFVQKAQAAALSPAPSEEAGKGEDEPYDFLADATGNGARDCPNCYGKGGALHVDPNTTLQSWMECSTCNGTGRLRADEPNPSAPLDAFQEPETRAGETAPVDPVVAHLNYMDGDQLIVREVTASEFYAQPEVDVTPPAQDPLLPPERPPVATPEQLEATGVIDGEAGWWARKLTREPA